jgi:hypothetical protein
LAESQEAIAYDLALRSMQRQEATLDNLRARAGTLLSAASLSTSFLAALGLSDERLSGLAWLAVVLFLAMGICMGLILWPWDRWVFGMDTYQVVEDYVDEEDRLPIPEMQRELALHFEENIDKNEGKLAWLFRAFAAGTLLLLTEIVVWLLVLARG